MYKISIIIPVYNVEDTITQTLTSLIKQTIGFSNLEIIIVDDCSTDSSEKIIKDYSKKYSNIKYYKLNDNSGYGGKPRNIGISHVTSQYVMFLDSDDYYYPTACEELYNYIISNDVQIVSGNYTINENGTIKKAIHLNNYISLDSKEYKIDNILQEKNLLKIVPAVWTKIFETGLIIENNIEFLEYVPGEDLYFVMKCFLKAKGILFVDENITHYETRTDPHKSLSVTSIRNKNTLLGYIYAYKQLYQLYKEYDYSIAWMASIHLYFATIEFVKSNLNDTDKLIFLIYAKELYKIFMESKQLNPIKEYDTLFNLIYNNEFTKAITLSNLMNQYLIDYSDNSLRNNKYYIIFQNFENQEKYEELIEKISILNHEGFDVELIINKIYTDKKEKTINFTVKYYFSKYIAKSVPIKIINLSNNNYAYSNHNFIDKTIFNKKTYDELQSKNTKSLIRYLLAKLQLNNNNRSLFIIDETIDNEYNYLKDTFYYINKLPDLNPFNEFYSKWIEIVNKSIYNKAIRDINYPLIFNRKKNELETLNEQKKDNLKISKVFDNKEEYRKIKSYHDTIEHDKTTIEYYKLKGKFKKKILFFLPYLYILYKHKEVIINIKLYKKLQNNSWFDIGYYLNNNSDLSRNIWCKLLTPETHYVCNGFNEKRLPHRYYKNTLTKKDILELLNK